MTARGKREARRPWVAGVKFGESTESAKYPRSLFISLFQSSRSILFSIQGRRASLRSALAPGCHIARLWRLDRALGANREQTKTDQREKGENECFALRSEPLPVFKRRYESLHHFGGDEVPVEVVKFV